jgi:hypothetical protein
LLEFEFPPVPLRPVHALFQVERILPAGKSFSADQEETTLVAARLCRTEAKRCAKLVERFPAQPRQAAMTDRNFSEG